MVTEIEKSMLKMENDDELMHSKALLLISADKIFSGQIKGFEDHSIIENFEFGISKLTSSDNTKYVNNMVMARDVNVTIMPGRYCAMIQGKMAYDTIIKTIMIKKIQMVNNEIMVLEDKKFNQCTIQSFYLNKDRAEFSFRYQSYNDSYLELKQDGTKGGNSAVSVSVAKWEIKES